MKPTIVPMHKWYATRAIAVSKVIRLLRMLMRSGNSGIDNANEAIITIQN